MNKKNLRAIIIIVISIFYFLNVAWAQKPFYKNYSTANGLPSSNAYYINQDKQGYIWVATDIGVSRFDGISFENYTTKNGLPDNEVLQVYADSNNRIWFMSLKGRLSYFSNDSIINSFKGDAISAKASFLYSFVNDEEGNVYTLTSKGPLLKIDKEGVLSTLNIESDAKFYMWLHKNHLYILASDGIYKVDKDFNKVDVLIKIDMRKHALRASLIKDDLLFAYGRKIYKYSIGNNRIDSVTTLNNKFYSITALTVNNEDEIWVGTKNGALLYNGIHALREEKKLHYLKGFTVTSILKDREYNLWFSTIEEGIFFTPSIDILSYKELLKEPRVTSLYKDNKNNLWIGSMKNNYAILSKKGFRNYQLKYNERADNIINIKGFKGHGVWITSNSSILNINNSHNRYLPYWANDILITDSIFWLGATACWKLPTQSAIKLLNEDIKPQVVNNNRQVKKVLNAYVNCFLQRSNGEVLIGTKNGLYKSSANYDTIPLSVQGNNKLLDEITDLCELNDKNILVGTTINGLLILDTALNIDNNISLANLSSSRITTILVENDSTIWIGTYRGLDKISIHKNEWAVRNFTQEMGLGTLTVNDVEIIDDYIYVGSNNGLIKLSKKNADNKQTQPLLHISDVSIDGEKRFAKNIEIKHSYQSFQVKFNAISFKDIEAVKYYYRIKERDNIWYETKTPVVNYSSLYPGIYTLQVKAVNTSGIESNIENLKFSVLPPFWETWWFYLLASITAIAILYLIVHLKSRYMKKQFELERANFRIERERLEMERNMIELEQKASRLQMNPHFIFNALNTIKSYYVDDDSTLGNKYINKFAKLLRLILENEDSFTTLDLEIELLTLYLDLFKIRYKDNFNFNIKVADEINIEELSVPSMLLQPFVENAVIHGLAPKKGKGYINITFEKSGNMLRCIIEDDGIGRHAASQINKNIEHNSKAIVLIQNRLQILSQSSGEKCSLSIEDKVDEGAPSGTKVTITIPFKIQ